MKIKVLMITHNRPNYVKKSLPRLCEASKGKYKITIWDNGSTEETLNVINQIRNHESIEKIIFHEKNDKLKIPTNWFWRNNKHVDLIGKVDDDCIVSTNWCDILSQAHTDIPQAGVLSCWHFPKEDLIENIAKKKIESFGKHKVLRNCWVGGSGYLLKTNLFEKLGYLKKKDTFSDFCIKAASKGYINGWYYPLVLQDHMDDPRSLNTDIKTNSDFERSSPLSATTFNIHNIEEWTQRLKRSSRMLQEYSINPYDYIGVKAFIKRQIYKIMKKEYFPKVK